MERRIQGSETPECHSDEVRKHRVTLNLTGFPEGMRMSCDGGEDSAETEGRRARTAASLWGQQRALPESEGAHSLAPEGTAQEIGPYNPLVCAEWALCFCRLATTVPKQILLLNQTGICLGVSGFRIEQLKSRTWPDSSWATPTASVSWGSFSIHQAWRQPWVKPTITTCSQRSKLFLTKKSILFSITLKCIVYL